MEDTTETISKLYALRAGMSVLSIQYDKYLNTICKNDKEMSAIADKLKSTLYDSLDRSILGFQLLCEHINGSVYYSHERQQNCLGYDGYHTMDDAASSSFWADLISQCCYFDLSQRYYYKQNASHYIVFDGLCETYHFEEINDTQNKPKDWINSFNGETAERQLLRDAVISVMNKNPLQERLDYQLFIENLIIGKWLLTDEGVTHFKTKYNELIELYNVIYYDTEALKPQTWFEKHFKKNMNSDEIAKNITRMNYARIAINNAKNAVEYIKQFSPQIKSIEQNCNNKLQSIRNEYKLIFNTLQNEFSPLLDVRDWESIDLIIYFMETRRADNIKEALQQVDLEKRTDRIVQTIENATKRICSTIALGFATLSASISRLETRIAEQNVLLSQQNSVLSELTSATNMNNALVEKQNVSSEKLMKEIKALNAASAH